MNKFGTVPDPMIITGFALTLCKCCGTPAFSRAIISVDECCLGGSLPAEHNHMDFRTVFGWMVFKTK
jgi:hypothetical protein